MKAHSNAVQVMAQVIPESLVERYLKAGLAERNLKGPIGTMVPKFGSFDALILISC